MPYNSRYPQVEVSSLFENSILIKKKNQYSWSKFRPLSFSLQQCLFVNMPESPDPSCFGWHWTCHRSYCRSHFKTDVWRQCLCLQNWHPLLQPLFSLNLAWPGPDTRTVALLDNKPRGGGGGSGYLAPDRCAAGCRVARRVEYRRMTDRYHNHTSPPLIAYLLNKTSAFLLVDRSQPPKIWREWDFLKCLWDEWSNMRKDTQHEMIPNKWGPQSCFLSKASPNRPTSYLTALNPWMLQLRDVISSATLWCSLVMPNSTGDGLYCMLTFAVIIHSWSIWLAQGLFETQCRIYLGVQRWPPGPKQVLYLPDMPIRNWGGDLLVNRVLHYQPWAVLIWALL